MRPIRRKYYSEAQKIISDLLRQKPPNDASLQTITTARMLTVRCIFQAASYEIRACCACLVEEKSKEIPSKSFHYTLPPKSPHSGPKTLSWVSDASNAAGLRLPRPGRSLQAPKPCAPLLRELPPSTRTQKRVVWIQVRVLARLHVRNFLLCTSKAGGCLE